MKRDYRELVHEVKELTSIDGFISACLEIKESMFFYERELVLSAYSSSVELLTIAALFTASLSGESSMTQTYDELNQSIDELLIGLQEAALPIDIQYLGEHFARGSGYATKIRLPIYGQMMDYYRNDTYENTDIIDNLLRQTHQAIDRAHITNSNRTENQVDSLLALVGTKMLRGEHLRPLWLKISHPRVRIILSGLQTMVNNFRVTPFFTFPLEDIATERQKRTKIKESVVVDLSAFRNFRQDFGGYTDLRIVLEHDEYDGFFEDFFAQEPFPTEELQMEEPDPVVTNILLAVLESRLVNSTLDDGYVLRALHYLSEWKIKEAGQAAVKLLDEIDPWNALFQPLLYLLRILDNQAVPAMRSYFKTNSSSPLLILFADLLAQGSKGKRKFSLLSDIFAASAWGEGKEQVAMALARFGGQEALYLLESTLEVLSPDHAQYKVYVEEALEYMKARN